MNLAEENRLNRLLGKERLNRREAIACYCLIDSGEESVKKCSCTGCVFYPYRTGRGKQNPEERDLAIKLMCMWCKLDDARAISECTDSDCPLHPFKGSIRKKNP